MSASTFVDTSILVATQDPRDPAARVRAANRLELERASGLPTVSSNVLAELFVALTRTRKGVAGLLSADAAAERVREAANFNVVGVQKEHVLEALRLRDRHRLQWWDALNVASAKASGCRLFLTKDALSAPTIEGLRIEVLVDPRKDED